LITDKGLKIDETTEMRFIQKDQFQPLPGKILTKEKLTEEFPGVKKKIDKVDANIYQCKYCGKVFERGCALGMS